MRADESTAHDRPARGAKLFLSTVKSCEYGFGRERTRRRHVEEVVAEAVQHLDLRRELPVVLDEEPVEARVVADRGVAEHLLQARCSANGFAPLFAAGTRRSSGTCRRTGRPCTRSSAMNCASMPPFSACRPRIQLKLSITCVIPWLKSKPDRVAVADAARRRSSRALHGDRRTVDRDALGAELMAPRVLHAQLVEHVRPDRRDQLRRRRIHAVGEIGRAIGRRQPAADVRRREVLEEEVAHRQLVRRADLVVGLAEDEVHLLVRRDDAVRRQRDAERRRVRRRHGDDLAAGDQAAIDVLVGAVEMPACPCGSARRGSR